MSNTSEHIIKISGMTKKFGRKVILSDINLTISRGDSIAFIGRNGCGKSTLLKISAGLMPFEEGEVTHNGKLKFGYVPERFPAMNLPAQDYISHIGRIAGLQKEEIDERSKQLYESLFMQDMVETPVCYLSKGTIQKLAVVQAFLTIPDVLLLDEPISGQDMASQQAFIEMVNILNRKHDVTILCSCHEDYMVKAISNAVYEIKGGKLNEVEMLNKMENEKFYQLVFVRKYVTGDKITVPESVQKASIKVEAQGREITVYVTAAESDTVMREMLNDNFELKGLNSERIY